MKYIYYTADCYYCGKTNYYCYVRKDYTYCYICKWYTNKKYVKIIGNWDWA